MSVASVHGPWAVIAGASDGVGAAFAEELARHGVNLVLVARRQPLLDELAGRLDVETRVLPLDLSAPGAIDELAAATSDLEVGLLVYNAGADTVNRVLLQRDLDELRAFVRRNCTSVLEACHHFGGAMVGRGRGGVVLVTSGAAWCGGATLSVYGATKAFDLVLAEGLWASGGSTVSTSSLWCWGRPTLPRCSARSTSTAATWTDLRTRQTSLLRRWRISPTGPPGATECPIRPARPRSVRCRGGKQSS